MSSSNEKLSLLLLRQRLHSWSNKKTNKRSKPRHSLSRKNRQLMIYSNRSKRLLDSDNKNKMKKTSGSSISFSKRKSSVPKNSLKQKEKKINLIRTANIGKLSMI